MKKFKLIAVILMCFTAVLSDISVSAKETQVVSNYTSEITVTPKREYLFKTQLDVAFHEKVKEFNFNINDKRGSKEIKLNNLKTTEERYRLKRQNSVTTLNIYSDTPYPKENKRFEISYDVAHTKDEDENFDFAHIEVAGSALGLSVSNVYSTIYLPTDKIEAVSFSSDKNDNLTNANFIVEGNTVTVTAADIQPGKSVWVMIKMPEGTFSKAPSKIFGKTSVFAFVILLMVILSALYVLIMFFVVGMKEKIVSVTEYYPPDGLTPIETEYAYQRTVNNKACAAMVIYWAVKGYLKIIHHDNKSFTLIKLKDMEKNSSPYQEEAFYDLFSAGNGTVVTNVQLENKYYNTVEKMKSNVSSSFIREKLLDNIKNEKFSYIGMLVLLLTGVTTIIMTGIINSAPVSTMSVSALLYVLASGVIYKFFKFAANKVYNNLYLSVTGIVTTVTSFAVAFLLGSYVNSASVLNPITVVMALGAVIAIQSVAALINQKTDYASNLLGKIKGFRDFIKNPVPEKLSELISENEMYFYEILPYAICFGKTEKWTEGVKNIAIKPPYSWYENDNDEFLGLEEFIKNINELVLVMAEKSFAYYYAKRDTRRK